MPLFDQSVAFAGLSKSSDMSGFIVKPVFPYSPAHFSYHPRGKDAAEFTTPWTNSSAASPTHQASGAKTGGDNSSRPDSPVYLAIPKALYLHNPCCHDLACVMRHRYNKEHGQTAALNADLEHNRTRGKPYHSPRSGIHQKAQDNPPDLQSDSCEEQIKRMTAERLTGGRPSRMEPNYSGYPCMPPLAALASLSEQSRHLQPPPRGFAAFPPTHMTSELYQECSPMSTYGHPTKQPMFYYPQANVEVEHRTHSRDIGGEQREDDVPVIRTSAIPSPGEYYTFPPTLQGDIPLFFHGTETQPNQSFVHGLGYRCYAHPGFQIRNVEQQHVPTGLPSHRLILPGSDQRPSAAAVGLQKSEQHVGPSEPSHVLLRMEPISPTRAVGQSVLPPHFEINSLYPSITSRLDHQMERPVISPSGMTQDRPLDFSSYVSQIKPEHRKDFPVSPRTRLLQPPKQTSDCRSKLERLITTDKVNGIARGYADSVLKDSLKRHFPSLLKIKLEEPDSYEIDLTTKRRKSDTKRNREDCPQMPVIGSVFSLAQEYLNAPEALRSQVEPQRGAQLTDHCQIIPTTALKGIKPDPNGAPNCMCPEKCEVQMMEPTKIKVEKINRSDTCEKCPSPTASSAIRDQIKPQPEDATLSDTESMLATQICEPEKLERQLLSVEVNDASQSPKAPRSLENDRTPQEQVAETEPKPLKAASFDIASIPLEHLKLWPSYDSRLPDRSLRRPAAQQEPPAQIQAETSPIRQAAVRKRFVELHRTLCKRVSKGVSATSEQQLRTWRSQLDLAEPSSNKVQNVSSLLGIQARDKWLNEEINSALDEVLDRFREYIIHERCPFPHVMRTGAVFLPMLVVKEILFPEVPVTFIDQVLQEHKVQLRPTTLSEEKILTQLHKPCSSRLRRLMSLKHLPDVYADVLNLLYYSNVCKHLDSTSSDVQKTSQVGKEGPRRMSFAQRLGVDVKTWEGSNISGSCSTAEDKSRKRSATKTKSRVKSSSRRLFLDDSLSDEEDNHSKKHIEKESGNKTSSEDASPSDDSWTHPLTCEDFPGSGVEPEESSPDAARGSSGMIIKLKREEAERRCATFTWQRTGRRGRNLRPLSGSRKRRSLLKIKYCPYPSTCHSAERRRRWVLRSAVRRGAVKPTYPDLVGKRIRHLYEEDDKSEVWYRGEVLGVHEAHSDPLKTIFEVRYDSEPEWKYYLELLIDYQKGWLIIEEAN